MVVTVPPLGNMTAAGKQQGAAMALLTCKDCGTEVSSSAKACVKCGAKVPRTKWWLWLPLAGIAAFGLFAVSVSNDPGAQERSQARYAIDLCWETQKRKSLDPGASRLAAEACEMMERRFEERWNRRP